MKSTYLLFNILLILSLNACISSSAKKIRTSTSSAIQDGITTIPFSLHDNRILIPVMINDQGPFIFIFDTGGARSNTITPEVAKELGLAIKKGQAAHGAGNTTADSWETKVDHYSVGNLTLQSQKFTVLDLSAIKQAFSFPRLDGIIGFSVLESAITCIDFEKQNLIFKNEKPDCFDPSSAVTISFKLTGKTPIISGEVDGVAGDLVIDTGDRSAFSVFKKFAIKTGLDSQFADKPEVISGRGIGGPIPARFSTLKNIKLGREIEIKNVLARLPLTTGGYFAKSPEAGSVGNEVLRRFNIIFNYPKNEMILVKNRHFDEPFKFVPLNAE